MVQMLHFHCPACGTTLQLPSTLGGQQGPCPRCYQEIIAPNPTYGLGPRLAPVTPPPPPPPVAPEPFKPFSDSPPLVPRPLESPEKVEPILTKIASSPGTPSLPRHTIVCGGPRKAVLILSCILTGIVGYFIGQWAPRFPNLSAVTSAPVPSEKPTVVKTVIPPKDQVETVTPLQTAASPVTPPPATVSQQTDKPPAKISDQALAALKAFLEAPDWAARSSYVLNAGQLRIAMEAYSHDVPDGPTETTAIQPVNSQIDPKTGETLFIFKVDTPSMPNGFPVAVQETQQGWLVDWPAFVEFRDDHFEKFANGPTDKSGTFHLIVRTPPEGEDQAKNEYFVTYLLTPPMPDRQRPAFCKKNSAAHAKLQKTTPTGNLSNLVLEVTKKNTPDGKTQYLEILNVHATNWRPEYP